MKYSVEGIKDSHVIKSISQTDKFITISYLDKTQDVIETNQENTAQILKIMEVHAKEYVHGKDAKVKKLKKKKTLVWVLSVIIAFLAVIPVLPFYISTIFMSLGFVLAVANEIKVTKQIEDLDKYELYLKEVRDMVDEYQNIKSKEMEILPGTVADITKNKKTLGNIASLDSYSLEELKAIKDKVERYHILTGETPVQIEREEIKCKQKIKKINKKENIDMNNEK